jgi:hypothetical protein
MAPPLKVKGPYRVRRVYLGFTVVYMIDESNDIWKYLCPPCQPYSERMNAHRKAIRLNREWQMGIEEARRREYYPDSKKDLDVINFDNMTDDIASEWIQTKQEKDIDN